MTYLTPSPDALDNELRRHRAGGYFATADGHRECYCGHVLAADESYETHLRSALMASGAVLEASTQQRPCVAGREFHDEWIEQLCALIPEGDESRFSNPEGAAEAIILDCFRVYAARPDAATLADDDALVAALMHRWGCEDADEDAYDAARSDLATIAATLTERGQA